MCSTILYYALCQQLKTQIDPFIMPFMYVCNYLTNRALEVGGAYQLVGGAYQSEKDEYCRNYVEWPSCHHFFLLSAKRARRSRCGQGARVRWVWGCAGRHRGSGALCVQWVHLSNTRPGNFSFMSNILGLLPLVVLLQSSFWTGSGEMGMGMGGML